MPVGHALVNLRVNCRGRMHYIVKIKTEHTYYIEKKTWRLPLEKKHSS
jgi:hypothetical protein